ncbi:MAG: TIGR04086 family membrane protein [Clostridia bacterium]|nr:TIGR04086 family membrane protein [Clostridia bacterium]
MSKLNQSTTNGSFANEIMFMLKAVAISYIVSIILLFPAVLLATFQAYSDKGIAILVNIVTAFGTALAGFLSGRHTGSKGIFFGACCGVIYTVFLCLAGNLIAQSMSFGLDFVTALIIGVLCGGVGGIAGINTKRQRRR